MIFEISTNERIMWLSVENKELVMKTHEVLILVIESFQIDYGSEVEHRNTGSG